MSLEQIELQAEIREILNEYRFFLPVYKSILKRTGDKNQALDAIRFLLGLKHQGHFKKKAS